MTLSLNRHVSLQRQIDGSPLFRIGGEFLRNSAIYPLLDAIREITTKGFWGYITNPTNYVLFWAVLIQAYWVSTLKTRRWYTHLGGYLIGFTLYMGFEIMINGLDYFINEPYHALFGVVSLAMAVFMALQTLYPHHMGWQMMTSVGLNMVKISLISGIYMSLELNIEMPSQLTWATWQTYMESSGHQFILYGTLFFGLLLGLTEWQRRSYADSLRNIAIQLKEYSEWSLSPDLVADAVHNPTALALHRVERTVLFMDIRGFTGWTEKFDPHQAVEMLNHYYQQAESIIKQYGGHKPNFTADEVMTRFDTPDAALATALALQQTLTPYLASYQLAVGVGLHTGEVIEGLMGSAHTRKYDIIGDTVNTAKRLESAAGAGEIVLSAYTHSTLTSPPAAVETRQLQLKGKSDAWLVFVIKY